MALKNLMEDVVSSVVKEVLKRDGAKTGAGKHEQDIVAYVLNRVPARYITSERGVIHGKLESRFTFQQRTDILFLIQEAITHVSTRRDSSPHSDYGELSKKSLLLPHIMGEVLEETTFSIIPDVEVSLLYKDKTAKMIDKGWVNPYITNRSTKGYYHFWPEFAEGEMDPKNEVQLKIVFNHPKFNKKEIDFTIKVLENISLYESKIIPIALMQIKENVDISFLYE